MFSELGKIYGRPPRHAESADTRAEIKRHEDDSRRRRDDEDEEKGFDDLTDYAEVSVSALRQFLADFAAGHIAAAGNGEGSSQSRIHPKKQAAGDTSTPDAGMEIPPAAGEKSAAASPPAEEPSQAEKMQAQRAAQAYQSAYRQSPHQQAGAAAAAHGGVSSDSAAAQQQAAADMLGGEDIRRIHALIADLDILLSRGIAVLEIRPNATFLDGLVEAVKTALS